MIHEDRFNALFEEIGIEPTENGYYKFTKYCKLLVEWNQKINLTAITDDEGIAVKHFADSLLPLTLFDVPMGATLIDVGTGAGFPSVPMKIIRGDLQITLLDSLEKRLNFLRHLAQELGFDTQTVHARAEDAGKNEKFREKYDIATSRAVASLSNLAEYCLPFVKVGGVLLALKGSSGMEEAEHAQRAIDLCGGKLESIIDYKLPNNDPRTLVIVRKVSPTPAKYPRNSAQISKKSL